jgi:LysM repeat protein
MTPDAPTPDDPLRPRRRFSFWTLLAPAALIVVVIMTFSAVGKSCAFKDCDEPAAETKAEPAKKATAKKGGKKAKPRKRYRIQSGDTLQEIAMRFDLSEEDLKACNSGVFDFRNLQVGRFLHVDKKRCDGAAQRQAEAGGVGSDVTDDASE